MISDKKMNGEVKKKNHISYLGEILPDYQKRSRATFDNIEGVQKEIVANIDVNDVSAKSRMRKYFEEFANNSSIHGFNQLVAPRRHPLERFLAGIFILGSFACFIYASVISWHRYRYDGFIILLDQQKELIRLVKPALLICPLDVIDESKFPVTFKRYGIEDTPKNRQFFHYLANATNGHMAHAPDYQAAPPELWLGILYDLKKDFYYETSFTGKAIWVALDGLCLSIGNYIYPYASMEYILANNETVEALPKYPPDISNYQMENREIDDPNYLPSYVYYQNQNITEFVKLDVDAWVELIDPMELYVMRRPRNLIQANEQLHSTIEVELLLTIQATDNALSNKNRRKCRLPFDKGLKLWPIYSFKLCAIELRAQMLKNLCECNPYRLPRRLGAPVCNITQFHCIAVNQDLWTRSVTITRPESVCPLNCNSLYISQRIVKLENVVSKNSTYLEINIIFPHYKYSMKERFSFVNFMIAVGSAAGFFLGCSVLSGVEIFYYATLHFYTSKDKYKQN